MNSLDKSLSIRVPDKFTIGEDNSKLFLINLEDDEKCFELSGICIEIFKALKFTGKSKIDISTIQQQVWEALDDCYDSKVKAAVKSGKLTKKIFDSSFDEFINFLICHEVVIIE